MKESDYVSYLKDKFLKINPGAIFYKIPDSFGVDGKTRPYDYYTIVDGHFTAVEAKFHKTLGPFYFAKVKPHQIYNLRKTIANKCKAYLSVGIRTRTSNKFRKDNHYNYAWIKADIWFPAEYIPGKNGVIELMAIDINRLIVMKGFKGNEINEIYLSEGGVDEITRKHLLHRDEDGAGQVFDVDTGIGSI